MMLFFFMLLLAQVGINTTTPHATLDVNGNLAIRDVQAAASATNYNFIVQNSSTKIVEKVNANFVLGTNSTIVKAEITSGISLLTLGAFAGFQKVDFSSGNIPIDNGANFNVTTDVYKVPSTGIYSIDYVLKYGNGVQISALALGSPPSIGILKYDGTNNSILDQHLFSGVNVPLLLNIIISSERINSIYQLSKDDEISFGYNAGGISLSVLSDCFLSVIIRKISN